ncbi:MAG: LemA family protein [Firmicutes bacterium]|nr:LemA family protein [Candidatus Fermentithermobacillaceae bacterium]
MNWGLTIIGLLVVVVIAYVIWLYNYLVGLRQRVHNAWSQIDVQLKRRHDLIPNLVETVKAYAAHETAVFQKVTEARSKVASARTIDEQIDAERNLEGAVRALVAVAENYPELRSSENFKDLQSQLSDTESKIAFSRQFYNDTVMKYQTAVQRFPANLVASTFGFAPMTYFETEPETRESVTVQF